MTKNGIDRAEEVKSKVYVLYTGGTFGMQKDESTPGAPLRPMSLDDLELALPDSHDLAEGVEITLDTFSRLMDSSSMTPEDWVAIARKIEENYQKHDGFVIIQGTDTLAYTATALSFMLENLAKPVVVTGSQLPLKNPRTDAKLNYGHALQIAGYKASDLPLIPEVVVVFADKVLRGCRTRKMSANSWAGFDTPNCPPLGEIGEHVRIFESQIRPAPPTGLDLQVNAELDTNVLDISLYPGMRADHLRQILNLDNVNGVVFRTYGTGNASEDPDFVGALKDGVSDHKVVVNITQCPQGMVEMGLYAASVPLMDNGVISGLDMTPEAALAKLMVTMGTRIGEQVKLQMQISQRGEQSQNLFDFNFKSLAKKHTKPWSDFIIPDRRFDPTALSAAVLRMKNVAIESDGSNQSSVVDVYMNFPAAERQNVPEPRRHPRWIYRLDLSDNHPFNVVHQLPKEKMKNIMGDSDVTLTFVPSPGVGFSFDKLSLSMFTRA